MSTEPYIYLAGKVPVLVSIPHVATHVPGNIRERFTEPARMLPDTDWHVERLYAFARQLGVHMIVATHSRYVVDLNRSKDNASLYPGKFTTGLCPLMLFDGTSVYRQGEEPDAEEIEQRVLQYWQPYHDKLQSVLDTLREKHGKIILFDAHSIRSQVSMLFEGVLPDLNIGTADGASADAGLSERLVAQAKRSRYSVAYNGRFKGGYITRHYGNPAQGVHAVQLELAQKHYMAEDYPFTYDEIKARELQPVLHGLLSYLIKKVS